MKSKMFLLLLALFVLATPIFAQTAGTDRRSAITITSGIAMAIASGLCGLAQGAPSAPRPKRSRAIPELATSSAAR